MKQCGVYKIENLVNGDMYVGSTSRLDKRFDEHKANLIRHKHPSIFLQHAWNEYDEDNFIFKILLYCDKDDTTLYEQLVMDKLHPKYNFTKTVIAHEGNKEKTHNPITHNRDAPGLIPDVYSLEYDQKVKLLEQTIAEMVSIKGKLASKSRQFFTIKAEFDTIKVQFDYLKELKSGLQSAIRAEGML